MKYGRVKMFDPNKGYGFIVSDEDEEYFVHANDLDVTVKGRVLQTGQRVAFDVRSDMKGDRAVNVRLVRK